MCCYFFLKSFFFLPLFQVVQGEAEVVILTVGIGIGVTLTVLGTGMAVEAMITDQVRPLAQTHKMEDMGETTAAPTALVAQAITATDSPILATTKLGHLEPRTPSRPSRTAPATLSTPSLRHRLPSSILRRWCRTPCLHSSLSKTHCTLEKK